MLLALLAGFSMGFIMAIPPGPVGVSAMKLSLNKGKKQGMLLAAGNGIMDFLYCLLAAFMAQVINTALQDFTAEHPIIMFFIQMLIVIGIFVFGFINLRAKAENDKLDNNEPGKFARFFDNIAHKGPFLLGIAVALTNIPNPTFFPSLVLFTGAVQDFFAVDSATISQIAFALGFGLGNFSWLAIIVKVLSHYKTKLSSYTLAKIHRFAGFTLIGFGTILGYHVYTITKWPMLFRLIITF